MRKLQFVAEQSEIGSGREAFFAISLPERPGALLELCKSVVNGHNISELMYRRKQADKATIFVGFQMTDADDRQRFTDKLAHSKYAFLDISEDKFATQYGRHMIGGSNEFANNELLYEFAFPERPGALIDFLESVGSKWNISLFHYRSLGSDISRVLIGFEDAEQAELERALRRTVFECEAVPPEAAELFL
jgi:threonine dehydratase